MIDEPVRAPGARERRRLLEVLARAFRDNPMNVEIHGPDPAARVRANRAGLRALVLDSEYEAVSRVILYDDAVVGGFVALPPGGAPCSRPSLRRQLGCLRHQGAHAMDRWGQVAADLGAYHPVEPHWYLAILGVEPELQGQRLGTRLLAELLQLAARSPAPVYLESDQPESVRFYRARGLLERATPAVLGVPCWCLGVGFADARPLLCDSVRQGEVFA